MLRKVEICTFWLQNALLIISFCLFLPCGQIEGLMDDIDFKAKVSRQEFEDLCSDLFQRVPGPVQQALSSAEMNMVGCRKCVKVVGQTRVPARAGLPEVCGTLRRREAPNAAVQKCFLKPRCLFPIPRTQLTR